MQVKCKSKADTVCNADITNGGITMENYFFANCKCKLDTRMNKNSSA